MTGLHAPSDGVYLAFDTATAEGSVAVARGSVILAEATLPHRAEHAARLLPAIADVLARADLTAPDLTGVVVGEGPGSFTGVRVAAATAKGLTRALSIPLWAVSTLGATALAIEAGETRYVLFDARADRVYGACYAVEDDVVRTLVEPHGGTVGELLANGVPEGATFMGDAAIRHRARLESAGRAVVTDRPGPLARGLLALLRRSPELVPVADPAGWEPAYLRASVAVPA